MRKKWSYHVDTVFVIRKKISKTEEITDFIDDKKGTIYYRAALRYLSDDLNDQSKAEKHNIFIGATFKNTENGMYSFTPAHLSQDTSFETLPIDTDYCEEFKDIKYFRSGVRKITCHSGTKGFWEKLLEYTTKEKNMFQQLK